MRLLWFERAAASPAWQRSQHAFLRLDDWMEHHLNVDEGVALAWSPLEARWLAAAACLLLAGYALSGLTQVGPDEVAVVRRFGRPLETTSDPGLHWCWPWPIDRRGPRPAGSRPHRRDRLPHSIAPRAATPSRAGDFLVQRPPRRRRSAHPRRGGHDHRRRQPGRVAGHRPLHASPSRASTCSRSSDARRDAAGGGRVGAARDGGRPAVPRSADRSTAKRFQQRGAGPAGSRAAASTAARPGHPAGRPVACTTCTRRRRWWRRITKSPRRWNAATSWSTRPRSMPWKGSAARRRKRFRTVRQAESAAREKVQMAEANRDTFLARLRARNELSAADEWNLLERRGGRGGRRPGRRHGLSRLATPPS